MRAVSQNVVVWLTAFGLKALGALGFWIVGRWLIHVALSFVGRALRSQNVDPTLQAYLGSIIAVALNVVLVVAILGFLGIETTSFAALLAAAGIAIGAAWAGLLANFAAGAFLLILRPFKVGDFVSVGGVIGTVEEIGLFATTIDTPDNVRTFVGNNAIFGATIQNFSTNPYRRVDLAAQLNAGVDHRAAITLLKQRLAGIPNVLGQPAPDVEILEFTSFGPLLAVRPYCANANYWQVYFDTNRMIREAFGEAGYRRPSSGDAQRGGRLTRAGIRGSVPSVATRVRAQGTFVNWESPPVHAVDMTPDGSTLLVTNTSDDRLEVFTLGGSLPVHAASIPVGLDPVRCR